MSFFNHVLNPFNKQEAELKKARDNEIRRLKEVNKSDEEIIGCLMCMPETMSFIDYAIKHTPVPGGESFMRGKLMIELKDGYTKTVTEWKK
jgi:hypothetical protein